MYACGLCPENSLAAENGTNTALHCVMELEPGKTVFFPGRWCVIKRGSREEVLTEIDKLGAIISRGVEALNGVYLRLCDTIRASDLDEMELRRALSKHFPPPRVSELLRVARSPDSVYERYRGGFFGFKAALQQCRGYTIASTEALNRRRARRCAERLVKLASGKYCTKVAGWKVCVNAGCENCCDATP